MVNRKTPSARLRNRMFVDSSDAGWARRCRSAATRSSRPLPPDAPRSRWWRASRATYFFVHFPSAPRIHWPGGVRSVSFLPARAATAEGLVLFFAAISP